MTDHAAIHNENAGRLALEMWTLAGEKVEHLNVFAESLMLAVGMLNFPDDPRRQAMIIQEISDAAQDRAKVSSARNPR